MIFFDSYLLLMAPGLNVRHLHAVHAGDGIVKPRLPCQKPAFAQAAGFHRFTNSQHCCLLLSCNLCSDFTIPTSKLQPQLPSPGGFPRNENIPPDFS